MDTQPTPSPGTALVFIQTVPETIASTALVPVDRQSVMTEFDAIMERERRRSALQQSIMPANRTAILSALHSAGIVQLHVNYDGYGDSGQINEMNATLGDGTVVVLETVSDAPQVTLASVDYNLEVHRLTQSLDAAVEAYCYDILETHHSGYENNEGGNGDFTFDVAAGTIELVHNDVVLDHDTTVHEL